MHVRPAWDSEPARQSVATPILKAGTPAWRLAALTALAAAAAVALAMAAADLGWLPSVADDAPTLAGIAAPAAVVRLD